MVLQIKNAGAGAGMLGQNPPTQGTEKEQLWQHPQGEVGDEGCLGQFHIEGHLLGRVCAVDSPRGDNIVGEA